MGTNVNGPDTGFVAGLWRGRSAATNNAPIMLHGLTATAGADRPNPSRYSLLSTDPLGSRGDGERIWPWIVQSALWTNLADEAKVDQTITFGPLSDREVGSPDFNVSATASSGLPVTSFTSGGSCTVTGTLVHLTTPIGLCTITAHQAGDTNYNAAPDVAQSFNVTRGHQAITFPAQAHRTWGDPDSAVTGVTASSGLPITFSKNTGKCTVTTAGVVHFNQAGTCSVGAHQGGNTNWFPATTVFQDVVMDKAPQTINFPQPPDRTFGDPDFNLVATSSSGLVVKFGRVSGPCKVTRAGSVHLTGPGTCTVKATQGGNKNYEAAPSVQRSFAIN
jgi:hypothetical protein